MSQPAKTPINAISVLEQRVDDAQRFASEQGRASAWRSLPGTKSIGFMELRTCNCRWPINDPAYDGTVRYCGATCTPETSYCGAHRQIALAPIRRR